MRVSGYSPAVRFGAITGWQAAGLCTGFRVVDDRGREFVIASIESQHGAAGDTFSLNLTSGGKASKATAPIRKYYTLRDVGPQILFPNLTVEAPPPREYDEIQVFEQGEQRLLLCLWLRENNQWGVHLRVGDVNGDVLTPSAMGRKPSEAAFWVNETDNCWEGTPTDAELTALQKALREEGWTRSN